VTALPIARDVPPVLEAFVRQLLEPEFVELVRLAGDRQVDVRLSASGGRVRRRPVISFDAGPQDYCEP
jgi:hypothetical protein